MPVLGEGSYIRDSVTDWCRMSAGIAHADRHGHTYLHGTWQFTFPAYKSQISAIGLGDDRRDHCRANCSVGT